MVAPVLWLVAAHAMPDLEMAEDRFFVVSMPNPIAWL
jgi:hypothetical protein